MATFDISRVAFDPRKHYSSVRMQQGRVLTDDDWNENERIENEERRRSRVDVIGPFGSPDTGFRVSNLTQAGGLFDFTLEAGTLHLGGLRLEMDAAETYRLQKDWLQQPPTEYATPSPNDVPPGQPRFDLVYADAWQQPVSAVEDEALLETALGGPDTTTRLRTMRRVRVQPNIGADDCAQAWLNLKNGWQNNHLGVVNQQYERIPDASMRVAFTNASAQDDLCSPSLAGGYLGAENQAIRVQLTAPDRFTWGFDNAAPLYRVTVSASAAGQDVITMLTDPKDQYHWPLAGQIVEVLPWSAVLSNGQKTATQRGHFSRVRSSYNPDSEQFTIETPVPAAFGSNWKNRADQAELIEKPAGDSRPAEYFFLRVWSRGTDSRSEPEIGFTAGSPVTLGNTGLSVTFTGTDWVANDHWVIAVRPETPDVIVPWALTSGMGPVGVRRFFAPLALIRWTNTNGAVAGEIIHDCRKKFQPLTDQECCCTYTVGDGIRSKGDYSSIQEAIDNLPDRGGKICILPGEHTARVIIANRRQIHISGCGDQSIVRADLRRNNDPLFSITNSQRITIEHLTMMTLDGIAVTVDDKERKGNQSQEITIQHNRILACVHAVEVVLADRAGNNRIRILDNQIGMLDKPEGEAAIFSVADDVLVERNRLVVVPAPNPADPADPRGPDDGNDTPFDPCFDGKFSYNPGKTLSYFLTSTFQYVLAYVPTGNQKIYQAQGGIQIGSTSERVQVRRNEVIGGWGNGITLGHVARVVIKNDPAVYVSYRAGTFGSWPSAAAERAVTEAFDSTIYELVAEENQIRQMGRSGIGVVAFFSTKTIGLTVRIEDFSFYRNTIEQCALQPLADLDETMRDEVAVGGIILTNAENGVIRENRIERNGTVSTEPVCGIFIAYGEKIDTSDNYILDNGPDRPSGNQPDAIRKGQRGGIVIKMAFKFGDLGKGFEEPSDDSIPAVRVHDNVVAQPLGHALFLMAFGPVSVVNNHFTSQGTDAQNPLSMLASSVFILNLGLSKDLILLILKLATAKGGTEQIRAMLANPEAQKMIQTVQYLPNGKVLFTGNQTTLDMRAKGFNVCFSSQLIASLDDIGFTSNQSECAALFSLVPGDVQFDFVLFNTLLAGVSVRAADNRFTDGLTATKYSLLSLGIINTATGNQATHCLHVLGSMVAENSNLVLIDDECQPTKEALYTSIAGRNY